MEKQKILRLLKNKKKRIEGYANDIRNGINIDHVLNSEIDGRKNDILKDLKKINILDNSNEKDLDNLIIDGFKNKNDKEIKKTIYQIM